MEETFNLANEVYYNQQKEDVPMCQEPGCNNPAIECRIPPVFDKEYPEWDKETYEYYCSEHAGGHGFCCRCGEFIAGWIGNDDLCENCRSDVEYNEYDDEDDDIDYFDFND